LEEKLATDEHSFHRFILPRGTLRAQKNIATKKHNRTQREIRRRLPKLTESGGAEEMDLLLLSRSE
jgi:hypothetical protein